MKTIEITLPDGRKARALKTGYARKGDILIFYDGKIVYNDEYVGANIADWLSFGKKSAVYRPILKPAKKKKPSAPVVSSIKTIRVWARLTNGQIEWSTGFARHRGGDYQHKVKIALDDRKAGKK